MDKAELIITALQQRMGEMSANYELQIAVLRADLTQMSQELESIKNAEIEKQKAVDEYAASLNDLTIKSE
jgi:hypothetical protein